MTKSTVLDGKQWILELLLSAGVQNSISGKIYKDKRPSGSTKEDIVINSLTMTNDYMQNGVFNVNIYVPMISVTSNGITQYQKNNARLKLLADLVYPVLDDAWKDECNLFIVNHQDFEEGNENFYNFRVSLNAHPIFN